MQKANFDGQEGISQPDVDSEDTEAEWKPFWQLIFKHYKWSSKYQIFCHGDIAAAFLDLLGLSTVSVA